MNAVARVLVVDDDRLSRTTTAQQLKKLGYDAIPVDSGFAALQMLEREMWDVVLTDLRMPGFDGIELLRRIRSSHPDVQVFLMTAYATVETAVEAMRNGAADYLVKPFNIAELDIRLQRLAELCEARRELARLRNMVETFGPETGMIGRCPAMLDVVNRIKIFAGHRAPVLITGQTGTGKEIVAQALHRESDRSEGQYVPIACGTIPNELAESELFGHEKGSFTGATRRRIGSFERAHGGTLLLDDVDDLPLNMQVKLLRVLQEGTITRVGGDQEIEIDVRIVATNKKDLAEEVERGLFRDDLYYRLRGLEIHLPRLTDRGDDVLLLAHHFLTTIAGIDDRPPAHLSVPAAAALRGHSWPGNVRELRRVIESADILSRGAEILPEHLPPFLIREGTAVGAADVFSLHLDGRDSISWTETMERFEDAILQWSLEKAGGQQNRAAKLLGIPRTTFQSRLHRGQHD